MNSVQKEAIDNDVYHFTRLGFDLYRVHVWDTQISDDNGNLIENEYLDEFDYLLQKLKQHNINYVITPIAFWGVLMWRHVFYRAYEFTALCWQIFLKALREGSNGTSYSTL